MSFWSDLLKLFLYAWLGYGKSGEICGDYPDLGMNTEIAKFDEDKVYAKELLD